MKTNKKRIVSIFAILTMAIVLSCVLVACGENAEDKFTITFDTQGGSKIDPITIKTGESITLPNNPTKEGYIFDGWYLSDTFVEEFNATKTITGNITLYAKWVEGNGQEEPPTTYTVTFMNGDVVYVTLYITAGSTVTIPADPTREGYVFDGWYLDENFTEEFDVTKKINSDIIVYSKWGCQHTPVKDAAVEPTCTKTGLSEGSHCSKCGKVLVVQDIIPEKEHNVVVDNNVLPTCLQKGKTEGSHCADCGKIIVKQNDIPALGHNFVNKKCERCGEDYYSEGLSYRYIEDGDYYELQDIGTCKDSDIVIPSMYNGKPVKSVTVEGFAFCETITSVTIPDSMTLIDYSAFAICRNLTSITISASVTSIRDGAFSSCENLASIVVASGNTVYHSAGNCLIETQNKVLLVGCKNSVIPTDGSVTSIGDGAFSRAYGLKSITIPDNVTSIGVGAFSNCKGLTDVTISNNVTSIGNRAFVYCESLTSITIPNKVTSIGDSIFEYCTSLANVIIGNGVTSIGAYAFYKCTSLTDITIPDSVTSMDSAFYNCSSLTSITGSLQNASLASSQATPNSFIVTITNATGTETVSFRGCTGLTTVNWNVSECGNFSSSVFSECTNLATINLGDNVTIIPSGIFRGLASITSVKIPDSVTSIAAGAFSSCTGLKSITIPENVTSIGESAFYDCSGLTNMIILGSVSRIEDFMFASCNNLISITIPDSVTSIGRYAFKNCESLESITIPANMTSIEEGAFTGCKGIESINGPSNIIGLAARQAQPTSFKVSITSGTTVGNYAFSGCKGLVSITIPDSVTSIGHHVFYECSSLESMTIPFIGASNDASEGYDQVFGYIFGYERTTSYSKPNAGTTYQKYSNGGFYWYYIPASLKTVVIGNKTTSIPAVAFFNCAELTSITIGNSVTSINYSAFAGCSGLTSLNVAEGNTKYYSKGNCIIESESKTLAFGCKGSEIPADGSVTSIGEHAFYESKNITSITIPDSVTSIARNAFYNCEGLTEIIFKGTIEQWNAITKGVYWDDGTGDYTVRCTDGTILKSN